MVLEMCSLIINKSYFNKITGLSMYFHCLTSGEICLGTMGVALYGIRRKYIFLTIVIT